MGVPHLAHSVLVVLLRARALYQSLLYLVSVIEALGERATRGRIDRDHMV